MLRTLALLVSGLALVAVVPRNPDEVPTTAPVAMATTSPADALPLRSGATTLLNLSTHRGDLKSALCFGGEVMRGAPERNNQVEGDLYYFGVRKSLMVDGTIVDLGEHTWAEVPNPLPPQTRKEERMAEAVAGHVYLVHMNRSSDEWFLVRLKTIVAGDRCELEWIGLERQPPQPKVELDADIRNRLSHELMAQDVNLDPSILLREPKVILQVRAGATGGNPSRIDMAGQTSPYVDSVSKKPLDMVKPVDMHEDSVAYVKGGFVPAGKVFVIEQILYSGSAQGDTNGPGEFIVFAGKEKVFSKRNDDEKNPTVIAPAVWHGRVEIHPGEESKVYIEIANSSTAKVTIEGKLEDAPAK